MTLSSCVVPQKPRSYDFIPPATQAGQACLQRCALQSNSCKQRFTALGQQCLTQSRQQAVAELPGRIGAYEKALDIWEHKMRRYHRDVSLYELELRHYRMMRSLGHSGCRGKHARHNRDCRRHYPRWHGAFWLDEPVYPGRAPRRPTLERVTAELSRQNCQQQNQCAPAYQQCYVQCGGTVKAVY